MLRTITFAAFCLPIVVLLEIPHSDQLDYSFLEDVGSRIKSECACFLQDFARATKQFNRCAVEHAKPLRFCQMCTSEYTNVSRHNPTQFNDSSCVDDLVKSERFQIVMKVYDFQTGLWAAAHCGKCYQNNDGQWNQTEKTKKFFHRREVVQECFKNFTENQTNAVDSNKTVCAQCSDCYGELREVYRSIIEETTDEDENKLCVDIMSAMNDTRRDWKKFGCWKEFDKNYTDLILTFGIFLLTFCFYIGVRSHEKYKVSIHRKYRIRKEINYDSE